jgi:hypothetical protein
MRRGHIMAHTAYSPFISIYATSAEKMNGNCKLLEFFEFQGAYFCQKWLDHAHNRT